MTKNMYLAILFYNQKLGLSLISVGQCCTCKANDMSTRLTYYSELLLT